MPQYVKFPIVLQALRGESGGSAFENASHLYRIPNSLDRKFADGKKRLGSILPLSFNSDPRTLDWQCRKSKDNATTSIFH
jgi:hypothetical protein